MDAILKKLSMQSGPTRWAVWVGTAMAAGFLAILTSAGSLSPSGDDTRLRALENKAAAQEETNKHLQDDMTYIRQKVDKIFENTKKE